MSRPESHHRMDYVEFPSSDLAATKVFFGKVFGWEFVDYGPEYTAFNDGRLDGGFFASKIQRAFFMHGTQVA